jgi:hypothetical protein
MPRKRKGVRIKPRKWKYGKLKDKHGRIMPLGLQIYTFKRIFRSVNPHLDDPDAEMVNIDSIDRFNR